MKHASQNLTDENSYATPVNSKRMRSHEPTSTSGSVDRIKKTKIGKKLNLSLDTSPERPQSPKPNSKKAGGIQAQRSLSKLSDALKPQKESVADVQSDIKTIEAEIETMKTHQERKQQLNESIAQWKERALEALQDLQQKIEPKQSFAAILDHLKIPHEMFDINSLEDKED